MIRDELDAKDKTECALLQFVTAGRGKLRVLVVEGNLCLAELRKMLPEAELFAVTTDPDAAGKCADLNIELISIDYREKPLDFAEKYFDYIIAPRALETAVNPQDIAAGFGKFLRDTGFLLTSFLNIRHWKIIKELQEGHFYYFCRHMFSRTEMETLLCASFYKSTGFAPLTRKAPAKLLEALLAAGFENSSDDLETEVWLVKAGRSTPELMAIKSLYTPEIRKELSRLLHRIEFDVEREKSLDRLMSLCSREAIFPAYLAEFFALTVIHREQTVKLIAEKYRRSGMVEEADEFLAAEAECSFEQSFNM